MKLVPLALFLILIVIIFLEHQKAFSLIRLLINSGWLMILIIFSLRLQHFEIDWGLQPN